MVERKTGYASFVNDQSLRCAYDTQHRCRRQTSTLFSTNIEPTSKPVRNKVGYKLFEEIFGTTKGIAAKQQSLIFVTTTRGDAIFLQLGSCFSYKTVTVVQKSWKSGWHEDGIFFYLSVKCEEAISWNDAVFGVERLLSSSKSANCEVPLKVSDNQRSFL